jgi:cell wall-associated NlpC family hydrolase
MQEKWKKMKVKLRTLWVFSLFFTLTGMATAGNPADSVLTTTTAPIIDLETTVRNDIVGFAKNYIGSIYRYAGRSPQTGFDCSGFTHFIMKSFGVSVSASSAAQSMQGELIKLKDVQPGDLIFFKRSSRGRISHVGMVVSNDDRGILMIHSSSSRGVVIDNLTHSKYWRPKIHAARRVINADKQEIMQIIQELAACDEPEVAVTWPPILDERFMCVDPLPSIVPFRVVRTSWK